MGQRVLGRVVRRREPRPTAGRRWRAIGRGKRRLIWLTGAGLVLLATGGAVYVTVTRHSGGAAAGRHHGPSVLGETVTSSMAGWSWHFGAVPASEKSTGLMLVNPGRSPARVWVRFDRSSRYVFQEVRVPAGDARVVRRTPAAPGVMDGAVTVEANRSIVPMRLVRAQGGLHSVLGKPGTENPKAGQVPMPARSWRFPALPAVDQAVVLTIFNPQASPVDVSLEPASDPTPVHLQVPPQRSEEVSLSALAPRWAAAPLRIHANGDIIPERVALGAKSARFAYGIPALGGP